MAFTIAETNLLSSRKWVKHVLSKMGIDNEFVGRVVIDAQVGEVVQIYIAFIGNEELLEVEAPMAEDVVIHVVGGQDGMD